MSKKWSSLDPQKKNGIAAVFEAITTIDALSEAVADGPEKGKTSFRDLVAWINGPPVALPSSIKMAFLANPALRRDFDRLLERSALCKGERAAAASTGLLDTREGKGFRVRLKPSRGAKGQVYILFEFTSALPVAPETLVVTASDGECARLPLSAPQDSAIQILADEDSDVVRLLRDPKSEIFLW